MSKLFRPAFAAWIMSWAVTTFVSAAFRTDPVEASVMDWLAQWFAIADAVPPFAKIAFGSMLAAGFWILGKVSMPILGTFLCLAALVVGAFFLATTIFPLGYYEAFSAVSFWSEHFLAAILGASVGFLALYRGRAKAISGQE